MKFSGGKFMYLRMTTVFVFMLFAMNARAESLTTINCESFNHIRNSLIDEDGTPHWKQYSFKSNCSEVTVQPIYKGKPEGPSYTDKIDGKFRCKKGLNTSCEFRYKWTLNANGTMTSDTEFFNSLPEINRQVRDLITRTLSSSKGTLEEFHVFETFYKDGEDEWFNASTQRRHCKLSPENNCSWTSRVYR